MSSNTGMKTLRQAEPIPGWVNCRYCAARQTLGPGKQQTADNTPFWWLPGILKVAYSLFKMASSKKMPLFYARYPPDDSMRGGLRDTNNRPQPGWIIHQEMSALSTND
ncbi:hypothetical protein JOM56_000054 [Amanita muscaria]